MSEDPWYEEGLRFACTRCGDCCGGGPGTVRANGAEIAALARRLSVSEIEFRRRYTYKLRDGATSLKSTRNSDCIFYDLDAGCTVYEDRPRQCRTWPFWRSVVQSPHHWERAAKKCPGINTGRLHPRKFIEIRIASDGTSGRL